MARVFVSHSSRDNREALELFNWLKSEGFDQGFLDFDTHQGIPPGVKWEQRLYEELERAQAVILVLTQNWFESSWCFAELALARSRGKAVFPVIISPSGDRFIGDDLQKLDLTKDWAGGLERLARRLTEVALSSRDGFDLPAGRAPYPGFLALDQQDAAVYFGRDDEVRHIIQRVDSRRIEGGRRLLLVVGASGTGKSSLLRAGVLPRIRKATQDWIALSAFRPGENPLAAFSASLEEAGCTISEEEFMRMDPAELGRVLRIARDTRRASVLVSIDQCEELFTRAAPDRRDAFLDLLSQLLSPGMPFTVIATIRSDQLGELQKAENLKADWESYLVRPIAIERMGEIIRGPARIAGLKIEQELIERIVRDANTSDALPLVAFAIRRLYDKFAGTGSLQLVAYESLRDVNAGLSPLDTIVRDTAFQAIADLNPSTDERQALREAFVPGLVKVNDEGVFVRQPARWSALPPASHRLVAALAGPEARLLTIRNKNGDSEVEVAHEALFRAWPDLVGWLDEEREFLIGRSRLEKAMSDWGALAEADRAKGLISGILLERAQRWLSEHPSRFSDEEARFIEASERGEADRRRQLEEHRRALEAAKIRQIELQRDTASRIARRTRLAAVVLGLAACVALLLGYQAMQAQNRADQNFRIATETMQVVITNIARNIRNVEGIRLESVKEILSTVKEQVADLIDRAPQDPRLLETTGVMQSEFGDTYLQSGDTGSAMSAYDQMLQVYRQLHEMFPNGPWLTQVSIALNKIGDLKRQRGDTKGARPYFQESIEIRRSVVASDPSDLDAQADLASGLERIGALALSSARTADARAAYSEALAILRKLAIEVPTNWSWQNSLAIVLDRLGDLQLQIGSSKAADSAYQEALSIKRKLAAHDSTSAARSRNVTISLHKIGDARLRAGDTVGAMSAYEEALRVRRRLAALDPSNTGLNSDVAATLDRIGIVLLREGSAERSLATHEEANEIYVDLVSIDPTNNIWKSYLAQNLERKGNAKLVLKDQSGALQDYRESLEILQELVDEDEKNFLNAWALSSAYKKIGDAAQSRGDLETARESYKECLEIRRKFAAENPDNAFWRRELSVAIERVGEVTAAKGELNDARASYDEALAIRRELVDLDPNQTQWKVDVAVALDHIRRLANTTASERQALLTKALSILDQLSQSGSLSAEHEDLRERLHAEGS